MPAEKWIPEQLFLGGESELERQLGKNNRNVHVALMIHAKNVRRAWLYVFQSPQPDLNSRCPQDQTRPDTSARLLHAPTSVDD